MHLTSIWSREDRFQNIVISNMLLLGTKWISKLHIKPVNMIFKTWNKQAGELS